MRKQLQHLSENSQTLVNLEKDLAEKSNLIKEKPELADELRKLHRQGIAEVGDK